MKTLAILGCGKLANIVVDACLNGLLPDYTIIGVYSRTPEKMQAITGKVNRTSKFNCKTCETLDDLLALRPDYIVETASPEAMKKIALPALSKGISIVTLSIGALADKTFYTEVESTAQNHNSRVHLVPGAIGGFDVMRTSALMGRCETWFRTEKGPNSLKGTSVYDDSLQENICQVFKGNAKEAIDLFPTRVNVAVAASLASVGPENIKVTIDSTPNFIGDNHKIEIKNEQVNAKIEVYSKTADIAGWSVVNTLRNITSSIVF